MYPMTKATVPEIRYDQSVCDFACLDRGSQMALLDLSLTWSARNTALVEAAEAPFELAPYGEFDAWSNDWK